MTQKKNATGKTLLLERYRHVADGIATLFFPYAEVVIHHLEDQRIVHLANNLSKRQIGDDSALEELRHGDADRIMGPYEKLNWDGRRMRSVSTVLFDDHQNAIGVMCINFNIAVFDDMQAALSLFIKGAGVIAQPAALFKDDWQERINTFMHGWLAERQLSLNTLARHHRQALVEALYEEGAFQRKSAADYVANVLGMGRATVYKHVKKLKEGE
ncbi:putative transcriptional regulator YheO [Silvimonas terrae]|uniref:Putative transcriptional regulator YheO n=1 Tax=Silvimonas terrae TaxID=300266 RepID=A0A840R7N0_9NEIS|nr:PAS domain-containing protein [Silvimonas terrae]MBB5189329.1 putative transcriptional regulator YheO [Silvimonas terrae]